MLNVIWDAVDDPEGNYRHVLEHGVTAEEVEEVLGDPKNPTAVSASTGRPITFGWTSTGRHIAVLWEVVLEDPIAVYPVTAYEVPAPDRRKRLA